MDAPAWFVRELEAFDPDMRLRWSRRLELWQLERKVRRSLHPGTIKQSDWDDDVIRARDGYLLVASVPPRALHRSIFSKLRHADLWSNGGWEAVSDALDAYEQEEESRKWESFSAKARDYAADMYDWLKIRDGRSVYNVGSLS